MLLFKKLDYEVVAKQDGEFVVQINDSKEKYYISLDYP